jgi:hypothetical protein
MIGPKSTVLGGNIEIEAADLIAIREGSISIFGVCFDTMMFSRTVPNISPHSAAK